MSDNKIPDDIKDYPEKIGNLYIRADVATIGVGYFKYKALEKKLSESIPVSELKAFIKKWTASHFSGFDFYSYFLFALSLLLSAIVPNHKCFGFTQAGLSQV